MGEISSNNCDVGKFDSGIPGIHSRRSGVNLCPCLHSGCLRLDNVHR